MKYKRTINLPDLISPLEAVCRDAGRRIMKIHAQAPKASYKDDGSPVTQADEAAQACILSVLKELVPNTVVISEENAASHSIIAPECFFLVDPLDGTKEFLKPDGKGFYTVNIAMIERGEPVLGFVYAPAHDRMCIGLKGKRAWETQKGLQRSLSVRLIPESGAVAVASRSHRDEATNTWLSEHGVRETLSIGSSMKFCLVAGGEADVYPRFGPTMEWDTAAGDAVLRAAGGITSHPNGTPYNYGKSEYRNTPFIARGQPQIDLVS